MSQFSVMLSVTSTCPLWKQKMGENTNALQKTKPERAATQRGLTSTVFPMFVRCHQFRLWQVKLWLSSAQWQGTQSKVSHGRKVFIIKLLLYYYSIVLKCSCMMLKFSDGVRLPTSVRQRVSNNTLSIENVQKDTDQGSYTCFARNRQGHSSHKGVQVKVIGKNLCNLFN